jgi:hypothetical protein
MRSRKGPRRDRAASASVRRLPARGRRGPWLCGAALAASLNAIGCAQYEAYRPEGIVEALSDPRIALTVVALGDVDGIDRVSLARGLRTQGFAYVYESTSLVDGDADVVVDVDARTESTVYSTVFPDSRSPGYWIAFPVLLPFQLVYFPVNRYSRIRTYSARIERAGAEPRHVEFRAMEFGSNYHHPVHVVRRAFDPRLERLLFERLAYEIMRSLDTPPGNRGMGGHAVGQSEGRFLQRSR